jgi:hypothetical protein
LIKKIFTAVDDDDTADDAAAAAPVVLPPLFEKPNQDTASYMGCLNDPVCRRQGRNHSKAFCVICNERGHRNCMVDVDDNEIHIFLRDNQDPEKFIPLLRTVSFGTLSLYIDYLHVKISEQMVAIYLNLH